jgi:hypothetical protein
MNPAHRPKCLSFPVYARAEEILSDITILLEKVMKWCYCGSRMRAADHPVQSEMRQRLHHEVSRMRVIEQRMRELSPAYNEFLDLREEKARRKPVIERLLAVAGPWDWESPESDYKEHEALRIAGINVNDAADAEALLSKLPLWEAMREYLKFVPEARISEMESFFDHVGFKEGNRQAMESALKRHPNVFKTRKKKREKYIALKGAQNAASTNETRKWQEPLETRISDGP